MTGCGTTCNACPLAGLCGDPVPDPDVTLKRAELRALLAEAADEGDRLFQTIGGKRIADDVLARFEAGDDVDAPDRDPNEPEEIRHA